MILITGGLGRLGRHLTTELLKYKEYVRILVQPGTHEEKPWGNVEYATADLNSIPDMKKALEGITTVYHLAGLVKSEPRDLVHKINVDGTRILANLARDKKLIFMSSTAVYGRKPHSIPIKENTLTGPTDFYGQTKLEAEKYVRDVGGIVVRCTDIYGKNFEEGYFKVFDLLSRGKMMIIGDGKNMLHHTHINDAVSALIGAKNYGIPGETYLVAGKESKTQEELLAILARYLQVEPPKRHIPIWAAKLIAKLMPTSFDPENIERMAQNRYCETSKAQKYLKWQPKVGYEEGIAEMVSLWRRNTV